MALTVDSVTILPLPGAYTVAAGAVREDVVLATVVASITSNAGGVILAGELGLKSILGCCMGETTAVKTDFAFTSASITTPNITGARTFFVLGDVGTTNS